MSAEEMLSRTVTQLPPPAAGVSSGDADRVEQIAGQLEEIAATLRSMAPDLGIKGKSAEAGTDAFRTVMAELFVRADEATAAAKVARRAYAALVDAKHAYQGLPPGEIDSTQRSFYLRGGMAINPGGMSLTGPAAVNFLDQQAAHARENQAQKILDQLNDDMTKATTTLPKIGAPHFPDEMRVPPSPGTSGGGTGSYTPGGGGSVGVGGVPSGSGAVLDQPAGSSGAGTGAGAHDAASGSWVTGPGGSTPGAGSADGSVGGTVPGANAGTGGIGTGAGAGTGIGGAGGVLAGGTAIGGAAVGATGLGRSGLGAGGAGGIGGAGRIGGIGGAGGAGGLSAGGAGGAGGTGGLAGGARGATGIGATTGASGAGTGTGAGAAAGSRGMTGMPMGGGGAAGAGSTKKNRTGSHGYLVPDLDIDDEPATVDLGPGAKAGSRDQLPPVIDHTPEDPDDETW